MVNGRPPLDRAAIYSECDEPDVRVIDRMSPSEEKIHLFGRSRSAVVSGGQGPPGNCAQTRMTPSSVTAHVAHP